MFIWKRKIVKSEGRFFSFPSLKRSDGKNTNSIFPSITTKAMEFILNRGQGG